MDASVMQGTRTIIGNLRSVRKDLRSKAADGQTKNRVQTWHQNLNQLTTEVNGHIGMLEKLNPAENTGTQGEDGLKIDMFDVLAEKIKQEIEVLINCSSLCLSLPTSGQGSSSHKQSRDEISQIWSMHANLLKQQVTKLMGQSEGHDKFVCLSKLLNIKDQLQGQIFDGMLYKKTVIWTDLNIRGDEVYRHKKVVDTYTKIADYQEQRKYLPNRLEYQEVEGADIPGFYDPHTQTQNETGLSLQAMIENIVEMEQLIKKNYLFTEDKIKQFNDTNPIQRTLRDQVEWYHNELLEMQTKYNQSVNDGMQNNQFGERQHDQTTELKKITQKHTQANLKIADLERDNQNLIAKTQDLQRKLNASKEREQRLQSWFVPRVKQTIQFQKDIKQELLEIKEDSELLPEMFRIEAKEREKYLKLMQEAEGERQIAVGSHNTLVTKNADLENELKRKQRLSMQAIAARSNIKTHLDEANTRLIDAGEEKQKLLKQLKEAEIEKLDFQNKHDEMFESVSGLNRRIEELETHKLHLLSKLKQYGDKGGLEYIVKTQKLESVKGKEFDSRVTVENYQPEKRREEMDEEYERQNEEKRQKVIQMHGSAIQSPIDAEGPSSRQSNQ